MLEALKSLAYFFKTSLFIMPISHVLTTENTTLGH